MTHRKLRFQCEQPDRSIWWALGLMLGVIAAQVIVRCV